MGNGFFGFELNKVVKVVVENERQEEFGFLFFKAVLLVGKRDRVSLKVFVMEL